MLKPRNFSAVLFATLLAALGCHAQTPANPASTSPATMSSSVKATPLSPELARRVEVLVRQKAGLPPGSVVNVGGRTPSDVAGYDSIPVTISNDGHVSRPIIFLLSPDGKTLAQFTRFDISANPRDLVSDAGRPARGGPENAPVLIIGFDDLECPYCARLHATIFPAITNRYGDSVHIVYRDFPLSEIHPWAMHAAVDVNCLAAQSGTGYWNLVDGIHAHASDIGVGEGDKDKTVARANEQLDKLTLEQGKLQQVDLSKLTVCLQKQDTTAIDASVKVATSLNLESTPVLFINGAKIDGALPIEFIFNEIDDAMRVAGKTPPPPYVAPPAVVAPAKSGQ